MAEKSKIALPKGTEVKDLLPKLQHEKQVAYKYQKRRHEAWNDIYALYRNKIQINRLTQRQSINIPLMKETIRTIGSKINEVIDIDFNDRGGDLDKNIIINTLFDRVATEDKLTLLDRIDKKQENLLGRSHFEINVDPTKEIPVRLGVVDTYDLLVDPSTDPKDIDTANYVIKTNIFKPLNVLLRDSKVDPEAKGKLQAHYAKKKDKGSQARWYREQMEKKNERLHILGIADINDLAGYDTVVPLDGHITKLWDKDKGEYVRYYVVVADESIILRADTLQNVMGIDFIPYEGWADDLELTDYFSDGIGDLIRVPNRTINMWISQHMENRTLRSFGMNFYNSKIKGFKPQTFKPKPFGWYPVPGNPDEVYKRVDIPQLEGTLEDIQFIVNIAERASATGAVEKGAVEDVKRTLGEIEIAVSNAAQRTNDMAPLYREARRRTVDKWYKTMEAVVPETKTIPLYKKAYDGRMNKREVTKKEWASDEGYEIEATTQTQQITEKTDAIVRMKAVSAEFPENPALRKAIQKRMVGIIDLTPEELDEIQQYEEERAEAIARGEVTPIPQEVEATARNIKQTAEALPQPVAPQ